VLLPIVCWVGRSRHASCCCLLGLAVRATQRRRAHAWPSWLRHAGGAGSHRWVYSILVTWAMATSHRYGLAGALAVHGAASIHSHTVGHAGAGAAVAGTGRPAVVRGPRVVTWKKDGTWMSWLQNHCKLKYYTYNVAQKVKHGMLSLQMFKFPLEFDRFLTRMTPNGCCELL